MPEMHAALLKALTALERHYRDIQDVEYTIEDGRLYILQTRTPSATPVPRCASPSMGTGRDCCCEEALLKVDPASLDALMHPAFDPGAEVNELTRGVAASPGAAKG